MTDQHRGDCLGAAGNKIIQTPNLDRIANEGVRFTSAYSSTPTCTPARTALLTGLSPWHHGMLGMTRMADSYPLEKPRALREAGYSTTTIGKNHFAPMRNGHGYKKMIVDEHCPCGEFRSRSLTPSQDPTTKPGSIHRLRTSIRTLPGSDGTTTKDAPSLCRSGFTRPRGWATPRSIFSGTYEREEPFFLKVSFIRPHSPYDPPERFMKMYADADLPLAQSGKWADKYRRNSDRRDIWHGELSADQVRRSRQAYYGCISQVDEQIGRILEALHKRGWLDETLVVFTSDHGDMTGDQHLWRKSYPYEPSAHVPMLMRWPGGMLSAKRGQTMPHPVELRDILPTFLEAAGKKPSREIDGRSLLGLVRSGGAGWREYMDLEHNVCYSPDNHWNALTDGRSKYLFHARDGAEQFFNLERDPHEINDLAGDTAFGAEVRRWRQRMIDHFAERGAPFLVSGRLGLRPESMMTSPNFPARGAKA